MYIECTWLCALFKKFCTLKNCVYSIYKTVYFVLKSVYIECTKLKNYVHFFFFFIWKIMYIEYTEFGTFFVEPCTLSGHYCVHWMYWIE